MIIKLSEHYDIRDSIQLHKITFRRSKNINNLYVIKYKSSNITFRVPSPYNLDYAYIKYNKFKKNKPTFMAKRQHFSDALDCIVKQIANDYFGINGKYKIDCHFLGFRLNKEYLIQDVVKVQKEDGSVVKNSVSSWALDNILKDNKVGLDISPEYFFVTDEGLKFDKLSKAEKEKVEAIDINKYLRFGFIIRGVYISNENSENVVRYLKNIKSLERRKEREDLSGDIESDTIPILRTVNKKTFIKNTTGYEYGKGFVKKDTMNNKTFRKKTFQKKY